ncbi:hypothetical protein DPX39_090060300 [Trypanosoma brucei equiperdum]|uniref:Uncharacterized protein n=1 Tax=Trypanosoma brucei equiperdum TaxID=630700 RepID=A0A3L6L1T2_9TRYP|nr:hypothetical protein DPX39_090060300 [Trypanosoma brucei equiperdum]
MSRSVDTSALRDVTSWRDPNRSLNPEFSALNEPTHTLTGGSSDKTALLEVLLPVHAKLEDREEVCRDLGVSIQTGKGGSNGLSRRVCMRLTDPGDPFFLFELDLLEDDYGVFKQKLELLVDFSGFPKYLVTMLDNVCSGIVPYVVSFVVDNRDTTRGTLRVLERTEFRTVEHISLILLRQGDSGQKRYLAERFRHFERAYTTAIEEHRKEATEAAANIEALKREVATLEETSTALRDRLDSTTSECKRNQLTSIGQLREEHASQLSQLRATLEADLRHTAQRAEETQKRLREELQVKEMELNEARKRIASLDSEVIKMRSELRVSEDTRKVQAKDLEELRSANGELKAFRSQATSSLSENELNCVKLQERLRGLEHVLESREKEHKMLRDQYKKQDNYVRILASQNEQLTEQKAKEEASLSKAHHIISTQLKNIKSLKTRSRMMRSQIHSQDGLIQEKENTIMQLRGELSSSTEKLQALQSKVTELRDQLEKTDDARSKLANELRCANDALISLQRGTSISGRRWNSGLIPSLSNGSNDVRTGDPMAAGFNGNYVPPSFGVYKELNKNASTTYRQFNAHASRGIVENNDGVLSMNATKGPSGYGEERKPDGRLGEVEKQFEAQQSVKSFGNGTANGTSSNSTLLAGSSVSAVLSEQNKAEHKRSNGQLARAPLDSKVANGMSTSTMQPFATKSFFSDDTHKTGVTDAPTVRNEYNVPIDNVRSSYF